jgi:hypothetical protein
MRFAVVACLALAVPVATYAADTPNPKITPGVAREGVTKADLCPVAHTPALRNVSEADKRKVVPLRRRPPCGSMVQ